MKFVLIFASSDLTDKLKTKIDLIKNSFNLTFQIYKDDLVSYYEKIIIDLPDFGAFVKLAKLLKCDITLDYINHDDYNYHTLLVHDDF